MAHGDLHGNTIWETALIILLIQLGAWGGYRVLKKANSGEESQEGKAVWDNWATKKNYHNYQPSAPPFTYGGRVTNFGGHRFQ